MSAKAKPASISLVPAEEVFSRLRTDLSGAGSLPGAGSADLLGLWRESLKELGFPNHLLEQFPHEDLEEICNNLSELEFQDFRECVYSVGHELARHQVKFHHVIAALDSLLESYLWSAGLDGAPPLQSRTAARSGTSDTREAGEPGEIMRMRQALAAARLCLLLIRISAVGYSRQWEAQWNALTSRVDEGDRRVRKTSKQLTKMYERERRRVSRVLYDQLGHDLLVLKLYLEDISREMKQNQETRFSDDVRDSLKVIAHALRSMRRLVVELGPPILEEIGLVPAIRMYARQFSSQNWIDITVEAGDLPEQIPLGRSVVLYRAFQEALSLARQGKALNVKVTIERKDGALAMVIGDDEMVLDASSPAVEHSLTLLQEHTEALGGVVHVEAPTGPAGGRRIEILIPAPIPEAKAG